MKNEIRIGQVQGSGAVQMTSATSQYITGINPTIDVPQGHIAIVTIHATLVPNASSIFGQFEVDGQTVAYPQISSTGTASQNIPASGVIKLGPGKHVVRFKVQANATAGQVDPNNVTMSWIIAPAVVK